MIDLKNMINYTANDYTYENDAVTWLDSHDKSRLATIQPHQGVFHVALAFLLTSRGTPVIYYGTEQYITGENGDAGRKWMSSFNQTTTAYQLIKKLSDLRKNNPAMRYGSAVFRWENANVLIYERQFVDDVVLVALNRSGTTYTINNLLTSLPPGAYNEYLGGLLSGNSIIVNSGGSVTSFDLGPYEVGVWQYRNVTTDSPQIGAVGPTIGRAGNMVTIDGEGFGATPGAVNFGATPASILCWANDEIKVLVPSVAAGITNVTVVKSGRTSNAFTYKVLSGPQVQVIFHEHATTMWGQNIYVTGDVLELDNWSPTAPYIPFFNPNYPEWFLPISVPANRTIQFKFIKRDSAGNVIWEGGGNRSFTTPASGTADTPHYTWQP